MTNYQLLGFAMLAGLFLAFVLGMIREFGIAEGLKGLAVVLGLLTFVSVASALITGDLP